MANLTLSVPDELYAEMKKHPEIRWSEVARQALTRKIEDLRRLEALLKDSRLREQDVAEVSRKVKERVQARHDAARSEESR
jgi:predicted CopG family antitoxin